MRFANYLILALLAAASGGCSTKHAMAASGPQQLVQLDSTVLNLADSGTSSYLRLGVSIALAPTPVLTPQQLSVVNSVAKDTVVSVVSARTAASLLTPQGKTDLKTELLHELQHKLPGTQVQEILFNEFLIQQ